MNVANHGLFSSRGRILRCQALGVILVEFSRKTKRSNWATCALPIMIVSRLPLPFALFLYLWDSQIRNKFVSPRDLSNFPCCTSFSAKRLSTADMINKGVLSGVTRCEEWILIYQWWLPVQPSLWMRTYSWPLTNDSTNSFATISRNFFKGKVCWFEKFS